VSNQPDGGPTGGVRAAPPVVLLGDEDRLTQALLALVVNATTHTPPGTPVTVDAVTSSNGVTFRVADTGPSIPPELAESVFEPFVTAKPDGPDRASGLGLSVVKAASSPRRGRTSVAPRRRASVLPSRKWSRLGIRTPDHALRESAGTDG
jgi:signal transduction histidine kinase